MANNVEERIVQMKFDNAQFEQGIKTSMSSLESFNKSLKNKDGTKGLTEISSGMEKITNISSGMIAKFAAITNVVNSAMDAGKNFVKAITIDPVKTGLNEYELKMGSVQTIMNGTGESLDVVMDKLEELNKYADRTIYSFQDMTSNIGKFTNAGVKLDVATKAIQGVSNLAAVSGASALDASRAMYNISQALGTGYMQLIDWKSIENANMATLEFKQTLIDTAKEVGTLNDKSKVTAENFRETLKNGWLTNDVLLRTLTKYTDETTELGKKAFAAATEIKTATQLFDVMKESVQSGWAVTWENIIGNFDEAKQLFTGIGQVFDFFASKSADARNSVLADWKELGGRQAIIQSLYNTFANLLLIIKPFKDAFRDVFPPTTGKTLADLSNKLKDFTGKVWISKDAADGLKNILTLLLTPVKAIGQGLKITGNVLKLVASLAWLLVQSFFSLFKSAESVETVLSKIFGDSRIKQMGESLVSITQSLEEGLKFVLSSIYELIKATGSLASESKIFGQISSFLGGIKNAGLDFLVDSLKAIDNLLKGMPTPNLSWSNFLTTIGEGVSFVFSGITKLVEKVNEFTKASGGLLGIFSGIGNAIKSIFTPMTVCAKEIDSVEETVECVTVTMDKFGSTTSKIITPINNLREETKKLNVPFDDIKKGLDAFGKKLKETIDNITPAKILIVGFGVSLMLLVKKITDLTSSMAKMFESFGGIGKNVSKMFESLGGTFTALKNVLTQLSVSLKSAGKSFAFEHYTKGIKNLAIAIAILSASVLGLTLAFKYLKVDAKYILSGAGTVVALTAAVTGLAFAFSKLDANGKVIANALTLTGLVLSLSISLKLLANAFNELNYALGDSSIAEAKIAILVSLLGGLTIACIALSKWAPKIQTSSISIIAMAVAMKMMVSAFESFSKVEKVSFENVIAISGMMVAASIAFAGLSKFSIKAAVGIGLFTSALLLVPRAVSAIESIVVKDPMNLFSNFMIFMDGLLTFMLASKVAGNNIAKAGVGILAAVSSLIVAAKAIKVLAEISPSDIQKAAPVLGGFLVIYGLITALSHFSGKNAIKAGIAIQLMSVALIAVVGAISLLTLIYDEFDMKIVNAAAACVGAMMMLFGVLTVMTKFAGTVKSITAIVVGIGLLLTATALMTLIPTDELIQTTKCLGTLMGLFAAVMFASSKIDWKGALAMTVPLIAISGAFIAMGKLLGDVDWTTLLAIGVGMKLIASGLSEASVKISKINIGNDVAKKLLVFLGVATTLSLIAVALGKFAQEFMNVSPANILASMSALSIFAMSMGETAAILSKAKFDNFKSLAQNLLSFLGIAGTMVGVGVALGKFAQEFMNIPFTGLISGAVSLGIMANAFAAATLVLSKADFSSFSRMGQNIAAFAGIAATMVGVGISLGKFAQEFMAVPFGSLASSAISLGIMANAFAAATIVLSKANFGSFETMAQSVIGFIGIAASMSIAANLLAPAFQKMADIPWDTLIGAGAAVAEMAVGMSIATGVLSLFAGVIQNNVVGMIVGAGAMIAVGAAARLLAPALKQLASIKFSSLVKGLISLVAVLGSLGAVAYVFGNAMGQILPGIAILAAFVAALYFLIPPLEQLSEIDFVDAIGGIGALAVAIVALGACSYILGSLVPQMALGAAVLIAFGAALRLIVPPLEQLSEVDFMSALGGIGALTVAIVALGACSAILGSFAGVMLLGSVSIAAFGVALMVLTPQLERVSQLDFMSVVQGIGALTVAIVAMGVCAGILGTLFPIMAGGVVILTGFGAAVGVLSVALGLGATAVESFGAALSTLPSPLASLGELDLSGTAGGLTLIALACGALGLAGSLLVPASVGITALAAAMELLSAAISSLNTTIENASSLANLFQAGLDLISDLIAGVIEGIGDLWQAGVDAVAGFADGVAQGAKDIWNTGVSLADYFIGGVRSKEGLDSHSPSWALISAALDAVAGWVKGTDKGQKAIAQSGKDTANTYINAEEKVISKEVPKVANEATDKYVDTVKSDEKKYEKAGEAVTEAQAEGMKDGADLIEKAGEKNGLTSIQGILEGMKESMPGLSSQIDAVGGFIEDKFGATLSTIDLSAPMQALIERSGISGLMDTFGLGGDTSESEGEGSDIESLFSGYSSGLDSVGKSGSGAAKGVKEATDSLAELKDQIKSDMDIFSKFDDTVDITVSDMIVNLQSQLDGVSKWSKDLVNLTAKGFDEAYVQVLAEMGLSGYKYVEALQDATQEQTFVLNLLYKESTNSFDAAIEYIKQALPTLTAKIAEETGKTIELVGYATEETEKATDAIEDAKEPVDELAESIENENEQTEEMSEQMEETQVAIDGTTESVGDLADGMEATQETVDGTTESVNNLAEGMDNTQETIEGVSDATEDVASNMDEAAESTEGLGNAYNFTTEQAVALVEGLAKIDSELETMKQSLKETIESQMDIFEKFDNESSISKDEVLSNMQSQINGITSWASNINKLADKGINEGLLAYLRELGPEGSKYVNAFLQMSETELSKAGELYETSLVLPDTVSQQMIDKMKMSGTYSIQGLIDSIAEKQPEVYNAGVETANAYNDGYTDTEQIHSPSKVQYKNGVNDAQGLINGLNSMSSKVGTTGKQMAYKLKNAINDVVNYDVFYKIGKNVDQGMANGIHDMAYKVATQAAQMAKQAYDAACKSLGINSPSKMFYDIGMYSDLGLVNGFRDYAGVVQTASESVGETALESMADVIAKLNAYAISDIEDPVIRPILDLSEIQNGARDVNSMLDFGGSYKLASSATKSFATSQDATVTYSNNYDNSDVVNAIGQLRADVANLKLGLGNVQVVMDTGTLVGELVDPIDSALGQKMNFNGRGV